MFGALFSADPNWEDSFNAGFYEFSATLANATISIDGVDSPTGKLAAFVGDEVRGIDVDGGAFFPPTGAMLWEVSLYSNQASGETITFKYYDDVNGVVMDLNESVVFESSAIYGPSAFDPFILTGTTDVTNTIALASNWNWISFNVYQDDMSLSNIFSSIAVANDGIDNVNFIKSQLNGTATWYETFGWFGDLANNGLQPTYGYQVLMNSPATLFYPDESSVVMVDNDINDELNREYNQNLLGWNFNPREYEFNGTVTFSVNNVEGNENDLLAAFVGDELRGVAERLYFPFGDSYVYIMQIYSNELNGEELNFKLYNSLTGEIYNYNESIIFESDMIIGDGFAAYNLNNIDTDIIVPSENSLSSAYPNPFNPTTSLDYALTANNYVSLVVYDINGQAVEVLIDEYKEAGNYNTIWNAVNYSSGIYFIGMQIGGEYFTKKVMLVK